MKDTMTISLEKEIKDRFSSFAKSLGTNPTNLLNMMIVHSMNTKSITFQVPELSLDLECFTDAQSGDLKNDPSIKNGLLEMETLSSI